MKSAEASVVPPARPDKTWFLAYAMAFCIVPLIGAASLLFPFARDQGIHATIAFALDQGLTTYSDVYNIKPPLTTAMHWLSQALFGHSMAAIRALDLAAATATALGLVYIARRFGRGPVFAVTVPVAFAILYYSNSYWELAQTDGWAGFLVVGALAFMARGWQMPPGRRRRTVMFCSGAVFGLAFAFKYTIAAAGILLFAPVLAGQPARFRWADVLFSILGGLTVLGAVLAVLWGIGALGSFVEIQTFITGYLSYSANELPTVWEELSLFGQVGPIPIFLVLAGLAAALAGAVQERSFLMLSTILLWIGAGWLSGHVQGKGFDYHFLPLLLPYAMLIAAGIEGVARLISSRRMQAAIVLVFVGLLYLPSDARKAQVFAVNLVRTQETPRVGMMEALDNSGDFSALDAFLFANRLAELREPGDGLFVWGYETMVYFLAQEPPRYRYPYSWPFVVDYYDGRYTDDLIARLKNDMPRHFVVQKRDATPWVTGRSESSAELLAEFTPLQVLLDENYRLAVSEPRYDLYELVAPDG